MANDLEMYLNLAKEANDTVKNNAPIKNNPQRRTNSFGNLDLTVTRDNFDERMAQLDDMVYGKPEPESDDDDTYSAEKELKRLKEYKNKHVSVSNPILQEVLNNPCDFDIDIVTKACNPKMDRLMENLAEKNFGKMYGGIDKAKAITKNLEDFDKQKQSVNEQKQPVIEQPQANNIVRNGNGIDYEIIKMIVENAIDKKLSQFISLNEDRQKRGKGGNTPIIMMGENKITFVDDSGNMYECNNMIYKGKMKLRKK